jgi:hypothetical protein
MPQVERSQTLRRFRRWWIAFHIAAAISVVIGVLAMVADDRHWGTLLVAGITAGTLDGTTQPKAWMLYGLAWDKHWIYFAQIAAIASITPVIWLLAVTTYLAIAVRGRG